MLATVHAFQKWVAQVLNMTGRRKVAAQAGFWMGPLCTTWLLSAVQICTAYFKHELLIERMKISLLCIPFTEFVNEPFSTVFFLI